MVVLNMLFANRICRTGSVLLGSYKGVLNSRCSNVINHVQNYAKSAEARLGIEKPKRPLTPFFKFMVQMRPGLLAKNPSITSLETTKFCSEQWKQLDPAVKAKMKKEYEKDIEDYKKIKSIYEASLTDEQKQEIKNLKSDILAAKEKKKVKAELQELGKPKRPMSSYFLFCKSKPRVGDVKNFHKQMKTEWANLPEAEKSKFEKESQSLFEKYSKDLIAWEEKMIGLGKSELVVTRKASKSKNLKTSTTDTKNKK